jgi:NAD(P)-dependent dehydrogenase (short-subunit alcohol dehydrogenase family)
MEEENDILLDIMQTNFTSVILLAEKLIKNNLVKNGKIIFLSSISGVDGSYDANYAAAKAALNLYVKSRVKSLDSTVASLIAICPSLIQDSAMYNSMSQVEWTKHKNRKASGELLKFDDLNLKIVEIINSDQISINGKIILI